MNRFTPYLIGLLIISIGFNITQAIDKRRNEEDYIKTMTVTPEQRQKPDTLSWIEKKIKNQKYDFVMLNSAPEDYLNKKLVLYGYAKTSNYYNYAYWKLNLEYYSVCLSAGILTDKVIYVYFPKNEKNKKLIEILAKSGVKGVPIKVTVIEKRFEPHQTQYLAEGLDWEVLK